RHLGPCVAGASFCQPPSDQEPACSQAVKALTLCLVVAGSLRVKSASAVEAVVDPALRRAKQQLAGRHLSRRQAFSTAASSSIPARAVTRVLVPVANDSEEIETACITDVLTRAGAMVTVASVEKELQVRMSRGLKVVADVFIGECVGQDWDVIALPGGMPGAERLRDSEDLTKLLKEQRTSGRWVAGVCASPAVVFATHGLLGESATCYPAPHFKEKIPGGWQDAQAVVDGNVITSQGPGTSLQFALKIVEVIYGRGKAEEIAAQMVTKAA
ncbi:unnamed protein product, partial [Polarella glacialis]